MNTTVWFLPDQTGLNKQKALTRLNKYLERRILEALSRKLNN
jgi:hypothetical protein